MTHLTTEEAANVLAYLNLEKDERLLLIHDDTTRFLAEPALKSLRQQPVTAINLDDRLGEAPRPYTSMPEFIEEAVKGADACLYAVEKRSDHEHDELHTFRRPLNKTLQEREVRYGNLLSPTPEVIRSAFAADKDKVTALTDIVADRMEEVKHARLTSPRGTDATLTYNPAYRWVRASGNITDEYSGNLMPAETYTFPASVDGTLVFDTGFAHLLKQEPFKSHPKEMVKRLAKNPLVWKVEGGLITGVECGDEELGRLAQEAIYTEKKFYNREVGEHGIPTNPSIKGILGNITHDEKGYDHLAHGNGYPEKTGAPRRDPKPDHNDAYMQGASLQDLQTGAYVRREGRLDQALLDKAGF